MSDAATGAVSGGLSGAAAGAPFGPVGVAAGGFLGAFGGALTGSDKDKADAQMLQRLEEVKAMYAQHGETQRLAAQQHMANRIGNAAPMNRMMGALSGGQTAAQQNYAQLLANPLFEPQYQPYQQPQGPAPQQGPPQNPFDPQGLGNRQPTQRGDDGFLRDAYGNVVGEGR